MLDIRFYLTFVQCHQQSDLVLSTTSHTGAARLLGGFGAAYVVDT